MENHAHDYFYCWQALILCQRYSDAQAACDVLLEGVDSWYLQAEIAWRSGMLRSAASILQRCLDFRPDSTKCIHCKELLERLQELDEAASTALDAG